MNSKKTVYGLLAILLLNLVLPGAAWARITDVPVDHWAYHAVNTAVNKEFLATFEDGTFQGSRAVDRYTLASVIARLLSEIEVARVKGTSADLELIRNLSLKFEEDLAAWYTDYDVLQEDLAAIKDDAISESDRLTRAAAEIITTQDLVGAIQNRLEGIENSLLEAQDGVANIRTQLREQAVGIGSAEGRLDDSEARLDELLGALVQLEKEIAFQREAISGLENWAAEKGAAFMALELADAELESEMDSLKQLNADLEKDLRNLAVLLQNEGQKSAELALELMEVKSELESAQAEIIVLRQDETVLEKFEGRIGSISSDLQAQANAALIREQRLERQLKELEEEFESYKASAESDLKSAKTLTAVALALAAVGAVIGLITH